MGRKQEAIFMGIRILAGLALSGSAAQAASNLIATPGSQAIYVDGLPVTMTAYAIAGNNYVKLRDVGEAVDFGVTYDATANSVYIDSAQPYQEETAPAAPSNITEDGVRSAIRALRDTYPTGTVYGGFYRSYSNGPYGMAPSHCAGWATLCSDIAFGNLPWRRISNPRWEDIRAGDVISYRNERSGTPSW